MSLLTPLYMLGLAGIALPILFHLIRRTPRGRQTFSSLMFLAPSPPRLTRRSRIEQWLLLLLRAAALLLLALAFARPFLREAASLSLDGVRGRRVAILLDTSASMQRTNVWQKALSKAQETINKIDPADDVALFTFSDKIRPIVDFDAQPTTNRRQKPQLLLEQLNELSPGWSHTDLGNALASVADILAAKSDETDTGQALQLIVISDVQAGSELKALQAYEWPEEVAVSIHAVRPDDPSNASLQVLTVDDEFDDTNELRVRITNSTGSQLEQFHVHWAGQQQADDAVPIYVPAGQSRVVRVARPDAELPSDHLVLEGDREPFDNNFYLVPLEQDEVDVMYVGIDDPKSADALPYYLDLAFSETRERKINIFIEAPDQLTFSSRENLPQLVVVNAALAADGFNTLDEYLRAGGSVLAVPTSSAAAVALASYSESLDYVPSERRTREDGYLMLADIDFGHPLFATFATPRYSDFTKIHFWNHQRFTIRDEDSLHLVARFDNGDPALWEQTVGEGKLFVMASGWHPDDSQLALSSKFVPLLNTLLDQAAGESVQMSSFKVGTPVPLPRDVAEVTINKPDSTSMPLPEGSEWFREADQLGIYTAQGGDSEFRFAVNLMSRETNTAPMDVDQLEQLGVRLGTQRTRTEDAQRQRQLRDIELEAQQKVWRWLIVGVLGVLAMETWLAGRRARDVNVVASLREADKNDST